MKTPRILTLEEALEYLNDDEYCEVTPKSIRLRKKILNKSERERGGEAAQAVGDEHLSPEAQKGRFRYERMDDRTYGNNVSLDRRLRHDYLLQGVSRPAAADPEGNRRVCADFHRFFLVVDFSN